jgi:SAM-dependent methyltransferase
VRKIRATLQWWSVRALDIGFDTLHAVDTSAIVPLGVQGVTSPNRDAGVPYDPSPWRTVPRSLRLAGLSNPRGFSFVDIGCGKGKVLLSAMTFPFAKIIGVEYSPYLCEIARRNVNSARSLRRRCSNVEIIHADAVAWIPPPHDSLLLFFYNPFHFSVMKPVLRNIVESYIQYQRPVYMIFFRTSSTLEDINNTLFEVSHGAAVRLASSKFGAASVNIYCLPAPSPQH